MKLNETSTLSERYAELISRFAKLEAYCDKLADGLPEGMLPKDVELLKSTNTKLLIENERLRKIEYAANAAYNYWAGGDEDLFHQMRALRKALGGE